ncbi:DUF6011 domain-containing protein [Streptomyces sp. NPDC056188]|uniref:DUF6011 domain-containing protein n=1 Tax=Streptomyces sp. NPDC056188 TaxID=3345740 RepID=UPI0035E34043
MTDPAGEEEPAICLGGCGRQLTSRISRRRGYGSDCWRKLHGRPALKPRRITPASEVGPGQTELDLYDHQPTLWSL